MERRLYRSRDDRLIFGVCGGLAKYFDIDPVIVRIITIVVALATGVGILAYIGMAIVVPLENSQVKEPKDVVKENVEEIKQTATQLGEELRSTFERKEGAPEETAKDRHRGYNILGIILVVIGVIFLLNSLFSWLSWGRLWPLILIAIGLLVIIGIRRR
jgi:phage shock protein PspC (stress-responsive transcriptional regulator)